MKTLRYITIMIALAVIVSSCSDYLEAPAKSSLDESVIFLNPTLRKVQ